VGFFDPMGGYLRVEDCVTQHIEQARAAGAELLTETAVVSWDPIDDGFVVRTAAAGITARRRGARPSARR
jgi:glycine/D-amino acid oxidase-like deaminating enzyme